MPPLRPLLPLVLALLAVPQWAARAQLVVEPGSMAVAVPQGQIAVETVSITNAGAEEAAFCLSFDRPLQRTSSAARLASTTAGEPCGEVGEVLLRIDRKGLPGCCADPFALTMTPDGHLFAAEDLGGRTYELTPDLQFVRSFTHPFVAELDIFPATLGVAYDANNGTLWWLNAEASATTMFRALLLEGDLDGTPTGRRIELPLAPAPPPLSLAPAFGLAYDPGTHLFYYADSYYRKVYAVDTLGAVAPGFPVPAQDAYPAGLIGNGLDAHGGEAGGPEGVRFEVPVALPGEPVFRHVVVTDRYGVSPGIETLLPDLTDGTPGGGATGSQVRSRLDPNGVMYVPFRNYNTAGVVGLRPHPLPPSWLALDAWGGTLGPGESAEVVLTFSAGQRAVGTYEAVLQVIEAETGVVTEMPLALTVTQGTAVEDGPETGAMRLTVYPSPARGRFFVEAEADEVAVYDVLGRVVRRVALIDGRAEVSAATLPAGVYVVRVQMGDGHVATRRVTLVR